MTCFIVLYKINHCIWTQVGFFFLSFWVYIQLPTFAIKTPFWLIFHWYNIFDQKSSNNHPNEMGIVSLYSRREILSYELKSFVLSFCWNFIVRAWIWGCSTHFHQLWEFEQLWITSGLQIKYKTHPYAHSSFHKYFTTCKFQAISLRHFTSPQACSWWIFERS